MTLGITPNQWTVLESLQGGARWKRSFQTVLKLLDDLIARQLVQPCRPHLGRGRNMVRLTDQGCRLLEIDPGSVPRFAAPPSCEAAEPPARKHNRTAQAQALLSDIEMWCERTATPEGSIGHVLFLHPGFVGLLRKRLTVSPEKEAAVRVFLLQHPAGWDGPLPKTHANGTRPLRSAKMRLCRGAAPDAPSAPSNFAPRIDREPCTFCGVRADVGCRHVRQQISA